MKAIRSALLLFERHARTMSVVFAPSRVRVRPPSTGSGSACQGPDSIAPAHASSAVTGCIHSRRPRLPGIGTLALGLTLLHSMSLAANPDAVQDELTAALIRLVQAGHLSDSEPAPLSLQVSAQTHYDLGIVADLASSNVPGIEVLAVSPGSAAERIGFRVGDRLLALNDIDLRRTPSPHALRDAVALNSGAVEAEVLRETSTLSLSGAAERVETPGFELRVLAASDSEACGRISVFAAMPRSEKLFPLVLLEVDDRLPGPRGPTYRLSPGRHTLMVSEAIYSNEFTSSQNHQRNTLSRRNGHFKLFEITIEPNTTYLLAARLDRSRPFDILSNDYWEPVVWKTREERCR